MEEGKWLNKRNSWFEQVSSLDISVPTSLLNAILRNMNRWVD